MQLEKSMCAWSGKAPWRRKHALCPAGLEIRSRVVRLALRDSPGFLTK